MPYRSSFNYQGAPEALLLLRRPAQDHGQIEAASDLTSLSQCTGILGIQTL
jgi:hypothetical protein